VGGVPRLQLSDTWIHRAAFCRLHIPSRCHSRDAPASFSIVQAQAHAGGSIGPSIPVEYLNLIPLRKRPHHGSPSPQRRTLAEVVASSAIHAPEHVGSMPTSVSWPETGNSAMIALADGPACAAYACELVVRNFRDRAAVPDSATLIGSVLAAHTLELTMNISRRIRASAVSPRPILAGGSSTSGVAGEKIPRPRYAGMAMFWEPINSVLTTV